MSLDTTLNEDSPSPAFVARLDTPQMSMAKTCPPLVQDAPRRRHENDDKPFAAFDAGLDVIPERG